ncbi:MAG TPA: pyridoxal phosphate-dependent aminotransferase [Thermomicrobiales bacterium]|nr:pyridoxal phosphate-dependent aminotransferase [Thermomicrobiales bacterium]
METRRQPADFLADRVKNATPSPTLAVSDKARQLKAEGIDVIDLGGGDPDFITPEHVRHAAAEAMNSGETHYVASPGTPAFRKAIASKLRDDNGLAYDPNDEILVTPGGKAALFEAAMALVEPGVDVLVVEPAWVSYAPQIELAGGNVVAVPTSPEDNWVVTEQALEAHVTPNSRVLLINSPNNPTGHVMDRKELKTIVTFANRHDLLVWTDEMYEKIVYDDHEHVSIATFDGMKERTLTFNGLSKAYAMTGWRLGYVAGPRPLISKLATVHGHAVTCATSFAQAGGVAALEGPQDVIGEMVQAWDRRRKLITEGVNGINGLSWMPAEGAFYAFVDGRETGLSSTDLAAKMLEEAHVAVVPGIAFGEAGEGHVRLSFATSDDALSSTIERLTRLFGTR